jgi:hypothetical protein
MIKTRLVSGVGINDAPYSVRTMEHGAFVSCPYYDCWKDMLYRCYSKKLHDRCPTYIGCSVHHEWHRFMNFREWMITQDWQGNNIDKDIIEPGNKVYSSKTCCFVPQSLNKLLTDSASNRGKYPIGVYLNKAAGRFQAYMKISGVKRSLGYYTTPEEASDVYLAAKAEHICDEARCQEDVRIRNGLIKHAEMLLAGY